ncbi:conserved protein, unknown function [Hepatocystis sp. ex Piliocolobus tephrosceles]|nr:conserved protein, unknown function [Hepatocystis sp. ex Piliocolobus tephrosceles]
MDLAVFKNDKNLSLNGINKMVDDVYNENLKFLLKKNKSELERSEVDQFSHQIETWLNSLDEEGERLHTEKEKMKETFQNIALELKEVKKSIKRAEDCINTKENGELIESSYKILETFKKEIDDL